MLGDIDGRAAILPAKRESLQASQEHEGDRREEADLVIHRDEGNRGGPEPHDCHGQEERVLPPYQVPNPSEHDGSEGPDRESARVRGQKGKEVNGRVRGQLEE